MTITLDRPAPAILDELTRRRFVAGGLGVGPILLDGCGDEDARPRTRRPPLARFRSR